MGMGRRELRFEESYILMSSAEPRSFRGANCCGLAGDLYFVGLEKAERQGYVFWAMAR